MPAEYSWSRDRRPNSPMPRQLDEFETRLNQTEQRLLQVENALRSIVASVEDITIGGPCAKCSQSLLLISRGEMFCPQCSYQRSVR